MKKTICVFCSSSDLIEELYFQTAQELGTLIGQNNYDLIHGGGMIGLMNILADAVQDNGGKVTGVVPERLNLKGIVSETDDEMIVTKDMSQRKTVMRDRSDAFIALPGGFGTLEEIMEIMTLKQLNYHEKPVIIINTNGFYNDLLSQFDKMFDEQFIKPDLKNLYYIAENPEDAMKHLMNNE